MWGVAKKETLFSANSSVMVQQGCENSVTVRQPRSQAPVWLDRCALLPAVLAGSTLIQSALACTGLLLSTPLHSTQRLSSARETQSSVLMESAF